MATRNVFTRWLGQIPHGCTGQLHWTQGNVSYTGDVIESYGWWPMARVIDWANKVALFRATSYSVTTSKHQSWTWRALHRAGFKVFTVRDVSNNRDRHETNLAWFEECIDAAVERADRATRRYREFETARIHERIAAMAEYIEYFGLDRDAMTCAVCGESYDPNNNANAGFHEPNGCSRLSAQLAEIS